MAQKGFEIIIFFNLFYELAKCLMTQKIIVTFAWLLYKPTTLRFNFMSILIRTIRIAVSFTLNICILNVICAFLAPF
jgi:hypothetical protein